MAAQPNAKRQRLAVIDVEKGLRIGEVATGIAPFGAVISRGGTVACVTSWGGRLPKSGELTAPTGAVWPPPAR